ncbi:MAG: DUF2845 domain-containing protein [Ramlibacter sp.]
MIALCRLCLAAGVVGLSQSADADSLRCTGGIVAEGDSRISVLYKCGQPVLADSYCAPVYYYGSPEPVPEPYASLAVPCQPMEEWLYDRGTGNLTAMVRIHAGVVQSITYARVPR